MLRLTRAHRTPAAFLAIAIMLGSVASTAQADTSPALTRPEKVGMSTQRLERINEVMARHIEAGDITGAVTAVARRGKLVHFAAHGFSDVKQQTPMAKDALFRMASSTKPVTGVAVLMLVEEGRLRLSDPVSQYIPEFKNMKVAVPKPGETEATAPRGPNSPKPQVDLVPANREITIKDLLTHTSGLMSGGLGSAQSEVPRQPNETLASYIPKLGATVLDFQPGTRWRYSPLAGIDTLGRIVEIVSGLPYDRFLRERIFEPLGMRSTFFTIPEGQRSRLLPLYRRVGNEWQQADNPAFLETRSYFSGAGGLMSAAEDYLRFEQMLLNRGELGGKRLLGKKTVELMGMNHVGDLYKGIRGGDEGLGFGLTVYVTLDEAKAPTWRSPGSFGWAGAFGTISWNDKQEELVGVLLIQQPNAQVQRDFHTAVMQAIVE